MALPLPAPRRPCAHDVNSLYVRKRYALKQCIVNSLYSGYVAGQLYLSNCQLPGSMRISLLLASVDSSHTDTSEYQSSNPLSQHLRHRCHRPRNFSVSILSVLFQSCIRERGPNRVEWSFCSAYRFVR